MVLDQAESGAGCIGSAFRLWRLFESRSLKGERKAQKIGWGGRIRTFTVLINSEVSYQLDHAPAAC
jgi:hypothetical protein